MDRLRQKLSDGEGDRSSEGEEEPAVVVSEKSGVGWRENTAPY